MDRVQIEAKAYELQSEIWRCRLELWPLGVPRPAAMLEPEVAARVLGIEFAYYESLGRFGNRSDRFEIAGMLDRERGIVAVATTFPYATQRFTGAHELGHWLLHPGEVMHRDRPVFAVGAGNRPAVESEADYFAACFLAPARLMRDAFNARFNTKPPLPLTDAVAYHLVRESAHHLMRAGPESYEFAAAVANATSFGGRRFVSLAEEFGLSTSAMAIRLRELHLIED